MTSDRNRRGSALAPLVVAAGIVWFLGGLLVAMGWW